MAFGLQSVSNLAVVPVKNGDVVQRAGCDYTKVTFFKR